MTSNKNNKFGTPNGVPIKIFIPVKPVPASRPRVSGFGAYYSKNYTTYRKEVHKFLKEIKDKYPIDSKSKFVVDVEFICYKPKRPSNNYPRGDVDNYLKSPLDAITYAEMIWDDDIQIVELHGYKRYQREGEEYGTKIKITAYT